MWKSVSLAALVLVLVAGQVAAQTVRATTISLGPAPCRITSGSGSPEGVVTGNPCDTYWRTDSPSLYLKSTGTGNTGWTGISGGAAVTSVGLAMPSQFTVTGSPVTSTGTLTAAWNSQTANFVLAAPNGSAGVPTFRGLSAGDIPTILNSSVMPTLTVDTLKFNQVIGDATLVWDTNYTLALKFGANPQAFRIYGTTTGPKYGVLASNASGDLLFGTNAVAGAWLVSNAGSFLAGTDNTYDIGASASGRPKNGYFTGTVTAPTFTGSLNGNANTVTNGVYTSTTYTDPSWLVITKVKSPATTGVSTFTGPAAATTRAKTVRDADDTLLELGGSYTPSGTWVWTTASVTWPTFNQNTTGSAAKWTTARTLAGNSVDGSANVAFSNGFIVKGTSDAGLSNAQFLGALATGLVKNTTTTGVLSIAAAADIASTIGSQTANTFYAAPNGSAGTPSFRVIDKADVPTTLNGTAFAGHVTPGTGSTYDLGSSSVQWRNGYIDSLASTVFTLNTQQLFGGYSVIGYNAGTLGAAVASGDTTVNFGGAITLTYQQFVLIRAADTSGAVTLEYMQITSNPNCTTACTVTRNLSGAGLKNWAVGTPFLVLGYNGSPRIELTANAANAPRISFVKQGTAYGFTPKTDEVARIGDLNGNWGYVASTMGLVFGTYPDTGSSASRLQLDEANGVRMIFRTGGADSTRFWLKADGSGQLANSSITWDTSGNLTMAGSATISGWSIGSAAITKVAGGNTIGVDSGGTNAFYAGTTGSPQFKVTPAGALTATSGTIGGWTLGSTALTAGSGATTVGLDAGGTNPAIYAGSATPASAPFRVTQAGAVTATNATITGAITASSGSFTGGLSIGASGSIYTNTAGNNRVVIDTNGINGIDSSNTTQFTLSSSTGKASAGAGAVVLDSGGIYISPIASSGGFTYANANAVKWTTSTTDRTAIWRAEDSASSYAPMLHIDNITTSNKIMYTDITTQTVYPGAPTPSQVLQTAYTVGSSTLWNTYARNYSLDLAADVYAFVEVFNGTISGHLVQSSLGIGTVFHGPIGGQNQVRTGFEAQYFTNGGGQDSVSLRTAGTAWTTLNGAGTLTHSGVVNVTGSMGFAIGSIASTPRLQYSSSAGYQGGFSALTASNGYADLNVASLFTANGMIYTSPTSTNSLNFGYNTNATMDSWINYGGYVDGSSRARNTIIGNGQGAARLTVDGANGRVIIYGSNDSGAGVTVNALAGRTSMYVYGAQSNWASVIVGSNAGSASYGEVVIAGYNGSDTSFQVMNRDSSKWGIIVDGAQNAYLGYGSGSFYTTGIVSFSGNVFAHVYSSVTSTAATLNSWTTVPFNVEMTDNQAMHDNSTNNTRLTVPTNGAGRYMVEGQVQFDGTGIGGVDYGIRITKSTAIQCVDQKAAMANSGNVNVLHISCICDASVGDYFELQYLVTTAQNWNGVNVAYTTFLKAAKIQ